MKNQSKTIESLRAYFGKSLLTVKTYKYRKEISFYVEYEDFLPVFRVTKDLSRILPCIHIVVKRECSDRMLAAILRFIYGIEKGRYRGEQTFDFSKTSLHDLMDGFEEE